MDTLLNLPLDEVAKKLTRPKTEKNDNVSKLKLRGRQRQQGAPRGRRLRVRRVGATMMPPIQDPSQFVDMTLDNYAKVKRAKVKPQATKRVFKTTVKRGALLRGRVRGNNRVNLAVARTTLTSIPGVQRMGRRGGRHARDKMQKLELLRQQQAIIPLKKIFKTPGKLRPIAFPERRKRGGRRRKMVLPVESPVIQNTSKRVRRQRVRKPKAAIMRSPEPAPVRTSFAKWPANSNASSQRVKRPRRSPRRESPFAPPPRPVKTQETNPQRFYMHDTQRWKDRETHSKPAFRRDADIRPQRVQKERRSVRSVKAKGTSYPTVKVSNVPTEYSRTDILGAFRSHFKVHDVIMKSRGTAFVLFHEMADARCAKEQFDGGEMNDHKIKVSWTENMVV